MSFEVIRVAVESHMVAWNGAPVAFDNVPASQAVLDAQANKTPWARLTINHGDSFTSGLGSEPCVRRTGLIQVQVFTGEDKSSRDAHLIADSLASHLQYYTDGPFSTLAASVQRVGPRSGYYQLNLSCPFRHG
ncbi:MAG TPA: phage tail terminator-like protein [Modicisalibacter sp.]|nr:phage tail terminator-like protein [Modicisalibacter sp.]